MKYNCPYCNSNYEVNDNTKNCPCCGAVYNEEYDKKFLEWEKSHTENLKIDKKNQLIYCLKFFIFLICFLIAWFYGIKLFEIEKSPDPTFRIVGIVMILLAIYSIITLLHNITRFKKGIAKDSFDTSSKSAAYNAYHENIINVINHFTKECNCDYCNTLVKFNSKEKKCPNCGNTWSIESDIEYKKAIVLAKKQDKFSLVINSIISFLFSFLILLWGFFMTKF